jgi:hypothetical protein
MRLYSFTNYYLSQLQLGLQTAHCVSEMLTKYEDRTVQRQLALRWAYEHKTIIICNGGNSMELDGLYTALQVLAENALTLPVVRFKEDGPSLACATTAVAVVVPAELYDVRPIMDGLTNIPEAYEHVNVDNPAANRNWGQGSSEYSFIKLLKSFRLA